MSLLKGVKLQSWTLLSPEHQQFLINLRAKLWSIGFALEIYTVRNMAAHAYANTIQTNELSLTLNVISNELIKCNRGTNYPEFKGSNHLHGLILLYKYLKDVYFMEFNKEYPVFNINHEHLPPLCKSVYISMNHEVSGPFPGNSTICHMNVKHLMIENDIVKSSDFLGLIEYYMSADKQTTLSFLNCFKYCKKNNENALIETFVWFLNVDDKDIFKEIMINIDILINKILDVEVRVENNYFFEILKKCTQCSEKDLITMLPVLSWLCPSNNVRSTLLPFICKYIDCDLFDSSDRCSVSKSLYYFTDLKDDVRIWNTVVELLQDEDTHVRVEVTRFLNKIVYNRSSTLNPYLCLKKMFEVETVSSIMNSKLTFICFWNMLKTKLRTESNETINPFFNEQSNVYREQSNIIKLAFDGLNCLIHSSKNLDYYKEVVETCLNTLRCECKFRGTFINKDLMILDTYSSVYFLKLHYKKEILILLNFKDHLSMFLPILKLIHLSTKSDPKIIN